MNELFRDIPGYEGLYQVSNLGNVKSLNRVVGDKRGGLRTLSEKILKLSAIKTGYMSVRLSSDGVCKSFKVHQLVAMVFLGHKPDYYKVVVDHIDNDKLNNRLDNLQLITQRENASKDRNNKTSKYTGVCWRRETGRWRSSITIDGRSLHLGYFDNELDASEAYINAEKKIHNHV